MSLSLSAIVSDVSLVVTAGKALEAPAKAVYLAVAGLVESAESAYAADVTAGESKKAAVLAAAEAFAVKVGADWSSLEAEVSALIDAGKAVYNEAASAISSVAPTASA